MRVLLRKSGSQKSLLAAAIAKWLSQLSYWLRLTPRVQPQASRRLLSLPKVSDGGGDAASLRAMCDTFHGEVMAQLEQGFEQFLRGRISLETYRITIDAQCEAAQRRVAQLRAARLGGDISEERFESEADDAENALAAAQWCQRWANEELCPLSSAA